MSSSHPIDNATPQRRDPARGPLGAQWRHSSFSQGSDQTCVDVAVHDSAVAVRDSKATEGPVLRFSFREWQVFLLGVRAGEFELPDSAQRSCANLDATSS